VCSWSEADESLRCSSHMDGDEPVLSGGSLHSDDGSRPPGPLDSIVGSPRPRARSTSSSCPLSSVSMSDMMVFSGNEPLEPPTPRIGDDAPALAPDAEELGAALLAARGKATAQASVLGGVIRYYEKSRTFVASCDAHGFKCRWTRSAKKSNVSGRGGQGRPLGLLVAWLGSDHFCGREFASREKHCSMDPPPNRDQRRLARDAARTVADMAPLFAAERTPECSDDDEPDIVP
jgi:hypothetical protein